MTGCCTTSSMEAKVEWKVRVKAGDSTNYFLLSSDSASVDWSPFFHFVSLPAQVVGAEEVKLYLELTDLITYDLDDVSLERQDAGNWEEEANQRIDELRRRDVVLEVKLPTGGVSEDLVVEVEQVTRAFPFGTAVRSGEVAACWDAGVDDSYCSFVRHNFNWLVDSYRCRRRGLICKLCQKPPLCLDHKVTPLG